MMKSHSASALTWFSLILLYMKMKNNRILLKTFTVDDQLGS